MRLLLSIISVFGLVTLFALPTEAKPKKDSQVEAEPPEVDRGVVLVVDRDRARLQRVDILLSQRGYTVVSMTRARVALTLAVFPAVIVGIRRQAELPEDARDV